jgi:hypothetical protein
MLGERDHARACFAEIRELLQRRGKFDVLEKLLKNEEFVGQALDHLEIKVELAGCYDEMEGREYDRAALQVGIARSLRARKEVEALANGLLRSLRVPNSPGRPRRLEKSAEFSDVEPGAQEVARRPPRRSPGYWGTRCASSWSAATSAAPPPRPPRQLAGEWFLGEWLETNHTAAEGRGDDRRPPAHGASTCCCCCTGTGTRRPSRLQLARTAVSAHRPLRGFHEPAGRARRTAAAAGDAARRQR